MWTPFFPHAIPTYGVLPYSMICYLPPSNSSRGDISLEFFNILRFQVSKYHDTGIVCICGDFNARVGSLIDTDSDTATSLPVRATLDNTVPNSHGRELIDFLRDVGMIILNGRGNSENNSFTYIGPNGSSVVDYCLIPIDKQHLFEDFKVLPILEASTNFHIPVDCSLPDHSILLWSIKLDCTLISNPNIAPHKAKLIIPPDYMESEHAANKVRTLSNHLHPHTVNRSYTDICDCIISELVPSSSLKVRKCSHPWWNPTLNQLKHDLRYCQRAWLKQKNNPQLKLSYQTLQKAFDKAVKKAKSEYRKHRQIHLLHQYKNDSKNFWRNFKQIGIDSERKSIPKQVINTEGVAVSEPDSYLQVWKENQITL